MPSRCVECSNDPLPTQLQTLESGRYFHLVLNAVADVYEKRMIFGSFLFNKYCCTTIKYQRTQISSTSLLLYWTSFRNDIGVL